MGGWEAGLYRLLWFVWKIQRSLKTSAIAIEFTHVVQTEKEKACTHAQTLDWCYIRSGPTIDTLKHACMFYPHRHLFLWTAGLEHSHVKVRNCHSNVLIFHAHGSAFRRLDAHMNNSIVVPIKALSYQTATHCQRPDCCHQPIAGPTNWNQLEQQAVSWDSWQWYEGLDWATPVQREAVGEEGWALHHWSRVTVMDRFRQGSWWSRFFSSLDSVCKDGHDGRTASKSNRVCICMNTCPRALMWMHMKDEVSSTAIKVKVTLKYKMKN